MSDTAPEKTKPNRTRRGGWYVNDAELIEIMGVPYNLGHQALRALDRVPGFPKKNPLWGNRRHLGLVEEWLEAEERRRAIVTAPQSKPRSVA